MISRHIILCTATLFALSGSADASVLSCIKHSMTNAMDSIVTPSAATLAKRARKACLGIQQYSNIVAEKLAQELAAINDESELKAIIRSKIAHAPVPFALYYYVCDLELALSNLNENMGELSYQAMKIRNAPDNDVRTAAKQEIGTTQQRVSALQKQVDTIYRTAITLPEYVYVERAYLDDKEQRERNAQTNDAFFDRAQQTSSARVSEKESQKADQSSQAHASAQSAPSCTTSTLEAVPSYALVPDQLQLIGDHFC